MFPVFSITCRPIAWRALCGVRPTTLAMFATSLQMEFIITSESRHLSRLSFFTFPTVPAAKKKRQRLPPLIVLLPFVLHVIANCIEFFHADLITMTDSAPLVKIRDTARLREGNIVRLGSVGENRKEFAYVRLNSESLITSARLGTFETEDTRKEETAAVSAFRKLACGLQSVG